MSKLSKLLKSLSFFLCLIFLCSNFKFKLAVIKASKIIEIINGDLYPKMNVYETENYKFLYDNNSSKDDIQVVKTLLDTNKNSLMDFLNIETQPKLTIRIVSTFNDAHNDSLGYVYFHNNILNILNKDSHADLLSINNEAQLEQTFYETILHEYTHSLINYKFTQNNSMSTELPFWLNEGIAEYIGILSTGCTIPVFTDSSIKPSDLDQLFENNSDEFYEKSSIFVSYLIDEFGEDSIGLILDYLNFYNIETSIEKATLENIDEISQDAFNTDY